MSGTTSSHATRTRLATRFDAETGVREEIGFFGPEGAELFGCTHLPPARPIGGLVICPPLEAEHSRNYGNDVALGRALCPEGVAVQRFHYRGLGNSDGDERDATFETMREDALAAAKRLEGRAGVSRVAFLGTRWGGLVAAAAAAERGDAPLVLWEPVNDPARYFEVLFRSRGILREGGAGSPAASPLEEMRHVGVVDVFGHPIHRALYESAVSRSLADELAGAGRHVLLLQIGQRETLRRDYTSLVDRLNERGMSVDARAIVAQGAWFAPGERMLMGDALAGRAVLVEITVTWLLERFPDPDGGSR